MHESNLDDWRLWWGMNLNWEPRVLDLELWPVEICRKKIKRKYFKTLNLQSDAVPGINRRRIRVRTRTHSWDLSKNVSGVKQAKWRNEINSTPNYKIEQSVAEQKHQSLDECAYLQIGPLYTNATVGDALRRQSLSFRSCRSGEWRSHLLSQLNVAGALQHRQVHKSCLFIAHLEWLWQLNFTVFTAAFLPTTKRFRRSLDTGVDGEFRLELKGLLRAARCIWILSCAQRLFGE